MIVLVMLKPRMVRLIEKGQRKLLEIDELHIELAVLACVSVNPLGNGQTYPTRPGAADHDLEIERHSMIGDPARLPLGDGATDKDERALDRGAGSGKDESSALTKIAKQFFVAASRSAHCRRHVYKAVVPGWIGGCLSGNEQPVWYGAQRAAAQSFASRLMSQALGLCTSYSLGAATRCRARATQLP